MEYNVTVKVDGKWRTFGSIKKNQWGNLTLGMKKTDEIRKLFEGEGWVNFSLFKKDDKPKQEAPKKDEPLDDAIPF